MKKFCFKFNLETGGSENNKLENFNWRILLYNSGVLAGEFAVLYSSAAFISSVYNIFLMFSSVKQFEKNIGFLVIITKLLMSALLSTYIVIIAGCSFKGIEKVN